MLRFVQIFIGAWVGFSALMESNWLFAILGGVILFFGLTNRGCPLVPGSAYCGTNPSKVDVNNATEIEFEEVKK